ncbi:MAG: DUF3883 domain-containing protein [Prosthecobacter sp.]|uniref:DUF3883 domain-containing protein n=1 Tax=Prosthecobacter sp. TaxID=1965333 RepID=UPI0039021256
MIPVSDPEAFQTALECLKAHRKMTGAGFKGRFIQIFLGLKFFQNQLPSMYSGSFATPEVLQSLLDDLYHKSSRPAHDGVLSLFEASYLARTGLTKPGNKGAQNTWRNNLHIQKGMICYAPIEDLSSLTFLAENRVNCRYLAPQRSGSLRSAECSLCDAGGSYDAHRDESQPKWLRADPQGAGYAVIDLQNIPNFAPVLTHEGRKLPVLPMIIALYHDSDPSWGIGTRQTVSRQEFMDDFHFKDSEFDAYFDATASNAQNARMLSMFGWDNAELTLWSGASTRTPVAQASRKARSLRQIPFTPVLSGTPVPPPSSNTGWDAEQYVVSALQAAGWTVHHVSRQQLGYDLFAEKGRVKRYVEVKSSLGQCSPSLTAREWQQALVHGESYILAVLENFNPVGLNTVYWVPDPATRCTASEQRTISHNISRSSWSAAAVPITALA